MWMRRFDNDVLPRLAPRRVPPNAASSSAGRTHGAGHWGVACRLSVIATVASAILVVGSPWRVGAVQPLARNASSGCRLAANPGTSTQTIDVGGVPRRYRVAVPSDATKQRPLPLLLNFHGANSTDVGQAVYSQLEEKGQERGFVVVTPNAGVPPIWDDPATRARATSVEASAANLAFTMALIDHAKASLCIDIDRVYATGFSNGAGMAAYLGCKLSGQFAGIAPVAGVNLAAPCDHGKPMSVIAFHGTADPLVAYGGGPGAVAGLPNWTLPSVETAVHAWAKRAQCQTKPTLRTIGTEVQRIMYRGCRRGVSVVLYAVRGGGHTWPGTTFDLPMNGPTTHDVNAADLILDFFAHRPATKNAKS